VLRVDAATRDDISDILASADALVTTDAGSYDAGAANPILVADLESIRVYPRHRNRGVGEQLITRRSP